MRGGGAFGRFGHFVLGFFAFGSAVCAFVFLKRNINSGWCYGSAMFGFFVFTAGSYCLGWMWNIAASMARRGGQMRNLFLVQSLVIGACSSVAIPSPTAWQSAGYVFFIVGLWAFVFSLTLDRFPSQLRLPSSLGPLLIYFCTFSAVLVLMSTPPFVVTAGEAIVKSNQPFKVRLANVPWNNKWCGVTASVPDPDFKSTNLTVSKSANGTWWVSGVAPAVDSDDEVLPVALAVACCEHVNIVGKGFRIQLRSSSLAPPAVDPTDKVDVAKRSPAMSEDLQSMILSIWTFVLVSVATALVKFAWGWATVEYQRV